MADSCEADLCATDCFMRMLPSAAGKGGHIEYYSHTVLNINQQITN